MEKEKVTKRKKSAKWHSTQYSTWRILSTVIFRNFLHIFNEDYLQKCNCAQQKEAANPAIIRELRCHSRRTTKSLVYRIFTFFTYLQLERHKRHQGEFPGLSKLSSRNLSVIFGPGWICWKTQNLSIWPCPISRRKQHSRASSHDAPRATCGSI